MLEYIRSLIGTRRLQTHVIEMRKAIGDMQADINEIGNSIGLWDRPIYRMAMEGTVRISHLMDNTTSEISAHRFSDTFPVMDPLDQSKAYRETDVIDRAEVEQNDLQTIEELKRKINYLMLVRPASPEELKQARIDGMLWAGTIISCVEHINSENIKGRLQAKGILMRALARIRDEAQKEADK